MTDIALQVARVWKLGTDIDTDQLAPGAYMHLGLEGIAPHCLEGVRPEFAAQVCAGDVLVAGPNFGIGSSREQAAGALVRLGVKAVIAPSFNGLYFRNAFNLGLLLITCAQAEQLDDGEQLQWGFEGDIPVLVRANGARLKGEPIPDFLLDMVAAGGLLNQLRTRFGKSPQPV